MAHNVFAVSHGEIRVVEDKHAIQRVQFVLNLVDVGPNDLEL